jgi:hypothetical protein
MRAVTASKPIAPGGVERYLEGKFGENLEAVRSAMRRLARRYKPKELAEVCFSLYEQFHPAVPGGVKGWGANGELELGLLGRLATDKS